MKMKHSRSGMTPATKSKYTEYLLYMIQQKEEVFDIIEVTSAFEVDVKLGGFLMKHGYIVNAGGSKRKIGTLTQESIPQVLEEFVVERRKMEDAYQEKVKARNIENKLKEFEELKHTIKHPSQLSAALISLPPSSRATGLVHDKLISDIVSAVKLGISLGKTDIEGFVKAIINIK